MKTKIEIAQQRLHDALAAGSDTAKLRDELKRLEAEAIRASKESEQALSAASDAFQKKVDVEVDRIVCDGNERLQSLLLKLKIKEIR